LYYALIDRPPEEIAAFGRLLSKEELARAGRFKNSIDRQRYLVRQGILRELLGGYLGCDPDRVEIQCGANGKPFPADRMNPGHLQFSDSHSENMAAFAFGLQNRLGIDIEKIRELPEMLEIVEAQFIQRENQAMLNCEEDLRLDLFYRFWTRKEAVLKAQGEGLLRPLNCVDVSSGGEGHPFRVKVLGDRAVEEFLVEDVQAPVGFAAAIAADGALDEISIFSE
jgi:4'-phosphopantetheinyl transferase